MTERRNAAATTRSAAGGVAGLEGFDCWLIKQDVELFEAMTGFETENSYDVGGCTEGRCLLQLKASESSGVMQRMCCGNRRPWTITVADKRDGSTLLRFERPLRLYWQTVEVFDAQGRPLGSVDREFTIISKNYVVLDASGSPLLYVRSPLFSPWTFTVYDLDEREVGVISKKFAGIMQELMTDADNFVCTFPSGLPTQLKALLLGAVMLIDFLHFEDNSMNDNRRRR